MKHKIGSTFIYADTAFYVSCRIVSGKWRGYLLCETWLGKAYFRED